jgi:hypothetical protein
MGLEPAASACLSTAECHYVTALHPGTASLRDVEAVVRLTPGARCKISVAARSCGARASAPSKNTWTCSGKSSVSPAQEWGSASPPPHWSRRRWVGELRARFPCTPPAPPRAAYDGLLYHCSTLILIAPRLVSPVFSVRRERPQVDPTTGARRGC